MLKKVALLIVSLAFSALVTAQDIFTATDLERLGRELEGRVQPNNMAAMTNIVRGGGYMGHLLFREAGPGFAEEHAEWSDIYFVTGGTATLITGGRIVDPVENNPGEIVGPRIEGGTSRPVGKGDIVHIPPGVPHHLLVEREEGIHYLILKAK